MIDFDADLPVEVLTDFESDAAGTSDRVLFRRPNFTTTTLAFVDPSVLDHAIISNTAAPSGMGISTRSPAVQWQSPAAAVAPWIRLTTSNAMFPGNPVNPVIEFGKRLRFDVRTDYPLRIGLALRETNGTEPVGANGGCTGTIGHVGVNAVTTRSGAGAHGACNRSRLANRGI